MVMAGAPPGVDAASWLTGNSTDKRVSVYGSRLLDFPRHHRNTVDRTLPGPPRHAAVPPARPIRPGAPIAPSAALRRADPRPGRAVGLGPGRQAAGHRLLGR